MTPSRLRPFLSRLRAPAPPGLFHPYRDHDPALEVARGPALRAANLREYLAAHAGARWVLVGEAAGYCGCRFSGIPFTGEVQLVGPEPLEWTAGRRVARTSREGEPWRERSAEIVWRALAGRRDCILWNAVPWHPHRPGAPLSNRPPARREIEAGQPLLADFLALFPSATPVAIGRVAESALTGIGIRARYVRHPSMGGQRAFLAGIAAL